MINNNLATPAALIEAITEIASSAVVLKPAPPDHPPTPRQAAAADRKCRGIAEEDDEEMPEASATEDPYLPPGLSTPIGAYPSDMLPPIHRRWPKSKAEPYHRDEADDKAWPQYKGGYDSWNESGASSSRTPKHEPKRHE